MVAVKRNSFLHAEGWTVWSGFTLFFPLFLAVLSAANGFWAYFVLCLLLFIALNASVFMVFLPSYRDVMRKIVPPPAEEGYRLIMKDRKLSLVTEWKILQYDMNALRRIVRSRDGALYLLFRKQKQLYVPPSLAAEFARALQ